MYMPAHTQNSPSTSFCVSSCLSVLTDTSFSRLFRTLYPNGLDDYATPGHTPTPSRKGSVHSVRPPAAHAAPQARPSGFLARWGFVASTPAPPTLGTRNNPSNDAVEELILSGAAFGEQLTTDVPCSLYLLTLHRGYGLFNLVLSLLPSKVR